MPKDKLTKTEIKGIEKYARNLFLGGATLASVCNDLWVEGFAKRRFKQIRDELFAEINNPLALKDLANGPILNPNHIIRYKSTSIRPRQKFKQDDIEQWLASHPA